MKHITEMSIISSLHFRLRKTTPSNLGIRHISILFS